MIPDRARPCTLYGLASSRDRVVRYLGQTRDGIQQAVKEHLADAGRKADQREFDCSDWLRKEIAEGFRLQVVPIATDHPPVWDLTLRAEIARRKLRGEQLLNRPPDLESFPKEQPAIPVTAEARANMSRAAKRRWDLSAGTRP